MSMNTIGPIVESTLFSDVLAQISWIALVLILTVLAWAVWSRVGRPIVDARWPGAVDRTFDALLPLPLALVVAEASTSPSPRPASRPLSLVPQASSPRSAVATLAGGTSSIEVPSASRLDLQRGLILSMHVEAIARELYEATVVRDAAIVEVLAKDGLGGLPFTQLPPRVREAYRGAAELALTRLDPVSHSLGVSAACAVAPNFVQALERYDHVLRHRPVTVTSTEVRA